MGVVIVSFGLFFSLRKAISISKGKRTGEGDGGGGGLFGCRHAFGAWSRDRWKGLEDSADCGRKRLWSFASLKDKFVGLGWGIIDASKLWQCDVALFFSNHKNKSGEGKVCLDCVVKRIQIRRDLRNL